MSVDKFGRYSSIGVRSKDEHCGLPLTEEGDYNISNKRLRFVNNPEDESDAINLNTLELKTSNVLKLEGDIYNAKNHRISNVANPEDDQDSVTKGYLDTTLESKTTNVLKLEGAIYDAKNHRISNIANPEDDQDSVTKGYLDTIIPQKLENRFSFYNFTIKNIGDPQEEGDAVNLKYIQKNCITYGSRMNDVKTRSTIYTDRESLVDKYTDHERSFTDDRMWDAKGIRIVNVPDGIYDHDCAVMHQIPKIGGKGTTWIFGNRRLAYCHRAKHDNECVIMEQTITLDDEDKKFDGKNKQISNIADPTELNDVANVNFIVRVLSEMFFDFYNAFTAKKINESEKDNWIRSNIVDKYFVHPKTKLQRNTPTV
jgi:hypothetical protein